MFHNSFRCKGRRGFTLIEVLMVMAVIGILATLAIVQFSNYRRRGYNAVTVASLRALATAESAYYVDHRAYSDSLSILASTTGFREDRYVTIVSLITYVPSSGGVAFRAVAKHVRSLDTFAYDIEQGGLQVP